MRSGQQFSLGSEPSNANVTSQQSECYFRADSSQSARLAGKITTSTSAAHSTPVVPASKRTETSTHVRTLVYDTSSIFSQFLRFLRAGVAEDCEKLLALKNSLRSWGVRIDCRWRSASDRLQRMRISTRSNRCTGRSLCSLSVASAWMLGHSATCCRSERANFHCVKSLLTSLLLRCAGLAHCALLLLWR